MVNVNSTSLSMLASVALLVSSLNIAKIDAFTFTSPSLRPTPPHHHPHQAQFHQSSTSTQLFNYVPPEASEVKSTKKALLPKIGDLVRYYDLDGGRSDGQELVGKLTFIQSTSTSTSTSSPSSSDSSSSSKRWLAEVTELDDVGEGYYAEYPSRKRRKSKLYNLSDVSPLIGSYVRTEDAFKIPTDQMGNVLPIQSSYDLDQYEGPVPASINQEVLDSDLVNYNKIKGQLLKDALIAGLVGSIIANIVGGLEDALIYFAGAIAGVGYLFFLSIKTDTVGSTDAKLGSNVSNLRFALPLFVLVGIAIQNVASGQMELGTSNLLSSVSKEQFGAAMLGFLTYRIPLFVSQLGPVVGESAGLVLPGSAGIAMQMAMDAKSSSDATQSNLVDNADLTTVLVVSGPAGTRKAQLVQKLIEEGEGRFVLPSYIDNIEDPVLYEQLEGKGEILQTDSSGRYGLTRDAFRKSKSTCSVRTFENAEGEEVDQVIVLDASVDLSKKMTQVGGVRLVGVWVGLDALDKFESRLEEQIASGVIAVPEDETPESVRRSKIREIVQDIEYGVVSGIFEFTIIDDDFDESLLQLKSAAEYCFK